MHLSRDIFPDTPWIISGILEKMSVVLPVPVAWATFQQKRGPGKEQHSLLFHTAWFWRHVVLGTINILKGLIQFLWYLR